MFCKLLALLTVLFTTSCATIFTGTSDKITFQSNPSGATILIDGAQVGQTPATVSVSRFGLIGKTVTLKKDGYHDATFQLQKTFNMVSILSILIAVLPVIIDVVTGAILKHSPVLYYRDLEPKTGT